MTLRNVALTPQDSDRFDDVIQSNRPRLEEFTSLLLSFNNKINLISRPSEEHVWERHIVHSLALACRSFPSSSDIVDWGTGGGLPAIPLAIVFPHVQITAIDRIEKKVRAIQSMKARLGLDNLKVVQCDAPEFNGTCSHSVSRATAPLRDLWLWHRRSATNNSGEVSEAWAPGLLCLKGGELSAETQELADHYPALQIDVYDLASLCSSPYFDQKRMIHVQG